MNTTTSSLYQYVSSAKLPTRWGLFYIHGFVETATAQEHVALSFGEWQSDEVIPIRIHSECLTGDALFSTRCDCGTQLEKGLQNIVANGKGVLLYLRQEGRGIGLLNKIRAYKLQDSGMDTVEANEHLGFDADMRDYGICKLMLEKLQVKKVNLMTNNPKKLKALESLGIEVVKRTPIDHGITDDNRHYIRTKTEKLGHEFDPHLLK
ncbi:MAG: GTP cyclohydrolase II [Paraglaciecola sp.]|uniref:GTP cyclohydrolase II n=1 Tax=Pseudomonadati TaxID=3379134 RepID=UPI00273E8AD3|nr:GTP cyclohydrolase II [Paraglaciecola sp.]MDP5033144.1 GTP cyclohydrolase II [Paraglaciecola sp.]MDP5041445.1 GTP cyclohydrolase II [Paraglaciecola sp.]MDP5130210.1 GTP cyclohydrolase II [Paraglaciecola sp.]